MIQNNGEKLIKMTVWNMASKKVLDFPDDFVFYIRVYMGEFVCEI